MPFPIGGAGNAKYRDLQRILPIRCLILPVLHFPDTAFDFLLFAKHGKRYYITRNTNKGADNERR